MATRHLFVLNPASGRKDVTAKLREIINGLKLADPYDIYITDAPRAAEAHCEGYINAFPDDFVRVYACGGDGTLSEVANGLYRSESKNCAMALVPMGSGNDFVRSFDDVSLEKFRDLKAHLKGKIMDIDLLSARDGTKNRVGLNIASVGFDAAVAKGQQRFKKLPLVNGGMAYNVSLVQCLFTKMKHRFTVLVDGNTVGGVDKGPYLFTIAANGKFYGGGYKAAPFSDMRDGLIDFIRVNTVSIPKLARLLGKFRKGEYIHEYKDIVTYAQCKKMQILCDKTVDLNIDGEIIPMRNPVIEVLPRALNIIMPE